MRTRRINVDESSARHSYPRLTLVDRLRLAELRLLERADGAQQRRSSTTRRWGRSWRWVKSQKFGFGSYFFQTRIPKRGICNQIPLKIQIIKGSVSQRRTGRGRLGTNRVKLPWYKYLRRFNMVGFLIFLCLNWGPNPKKDPEPE